MGAADSSGGVMGETVDASTATNWSAFHAIALAGFVGVLQSYVGEILDGHRWGSRRRSGWLAPSEVLDGLVGCGKKLRPERVAARPRFARIPAVQRQDIYETG
jgi:hypothetical protein